MGGGTDGRTPEVKDGSQRDAAEADPTTLTLTPRLFASASGLISGKTLVFPESSPCSVHPCSMKV